MFKYSNSKIIDQNANKVFEVVIDVKNYPKFIPWCYGVKIISKSENEIIADLIILFKAVSLKYTSRVIIENNIKNTGIALIETKMIKGPFKFLESSWKLKKIDETITYVDFNIKFLLKSKLLEKLLAPLFNNACSKILNSFNDHIKNSP
ncbi:type II toxin-antitoxin system RatA family toxin [Candidatus Bandiella numerosa]|uniref:type II toxin-antitoxin system RatA family toxin n=1 Tax=Candidatus Bandiella numerosa TaxID=2570586 RepID=UPI00249F74D6|nr:type II toxin-antitoxin system RatA family toxin [Candidatus Bandiella numerosa]WHA04934.1 type II toxin-antitoxin system RatA family toxin [Candidatus Bandiella numerosa]